MTEDFLDRLRRINGERYTAWTGDGIEDPLYLSNEFGGEAGEVQNVVKKLVREQRGWRGSRASVQDLADEIGDCMICLDNLARGYGIDLEGATVAKFNATSEKNGFPHRLDLPSPLPFADLGGSGAFPDTIGRLHLGDGRSEGDGRLCSWGHDVPAGHPLYWPEQISQHDDRDPCCLTHAIKNSVMQQGYNSQIATELALSECREKFAFYVETHRAKGTEDGEEKARANQEMVDMINRVLDGGKPDAVMVERMTEVEALEFVLKYLHDVPMVRDIIMRLFRAMDLIKAGS